MRAKPSVFFVIGASTLLGCEASRTPVVDHVAKPVNAPSSGLVSDPTDRDLRLLEGTWEQTFPSFARGTSMTIIGTTKTVRSGDVVIVNDVTLEIDASKNPKIWDERPSYPPDLVIRGVYMLDGDVLTRCFASPNDHRPTGFQSASNPNVGGATAVFERVKTATTTTTK